jgi:hypothetical protein
MLRHHLGCALALAIVELNGASCGKSSLESHRLSHRVVLAALGRCSAFAERYDSEACLISTSSSAGIVMRGISRKATANQVKRRPYALTADDTSITSIGRSTAVSLVSHRRATSSCASAIWRKMARPILAVLTQSKHSSVLSIF